MGLSETMNTQPKLGLAMDGNEAAFMARLKQAWINSARWGCGMYVEIGVAGGDTFREVWRFIRWGTSDLPYAQWSALGLDVLGGWSLNERDILARHPDNGILITRIPRWVAPWYTAQVLLLQPKPPGVHDFFHVNLDDAPSRCSPARQRVAFALIDGCHGYGCVRRDFEWIEPMMLPGGIVAFHDANEACQGQHHQPHCGTGIDVRRAIRDLGLLPDSTDRRCGWEFLEEVSGAAHGCVFVASASGT